MFRRLSIILLGASLLLSVGCASKQEAKPADAESAPAAREVQPAPPAEEAQEMEDGVSAPKNEVAPEPAPAPPVDATEEERKEAVEVDDLKGSVAPDAASGPAAAPDDSAVKKSKDEAPAPSKPALKRRSTTSAPAAKEAPCDPEKDQDCDPSLLRKLPSR